MSYQKYLKLKDSNSYLQEVILFSSKNKIDNIKHLSDYFENTDVETFLPECIEGNHHLAMILNSSGTTGLPKGVIISHSNVITKIVHKL